MKSVALAVQERGDEPVARILRGEGQIPGVIYGAGGANIKVQLDGYQFSRSGLRGHGAHLISFDCDNPALSGSLALIKEVQVHPLSGAVVHIDFLRVDMNKPVTASVTLNYVGKPAGVVEGGLLQPIRRELEVRALPANLPEHVDVDVSGLAIHDTVHVADVQMGEGVEAIYSENFTLVTVVPPTVEAEPTEEEEGVETPEGEAGAETPAAADSEDSGS